MDGKCCSADPTNYSPRLVYFYCLFIAIAAIYLVGVLLLLENASARVCA
jgi:hypothetical protein